ncbi:DUF6957 family protein [Stutzerimonas kunmingensis]|uniref:DUF6957 family protein n=1 Tax=Stutzerimonas kunmingensis TaxID=1211807 RepID=UPI0028AA27ED|nr:hypothetical protein [Stutzerimonas kunmingensis]
MKLQFLDISGNQKALEIADFLWGKAPAINGTDLSRAEILHELHRRNTKKQYCLVKDWTLVELEISDEARLQIEADGFVARLIHANEVVEDSAGRFPPGYWVRSSLQQRYEGDGFFETRSTIYVLLGVGRHKKVRDDIVYSIRP